MVEHYDVKIKVIKNYYVEKYKGTQVNVMYFHYFYEMFVTDMYIMSCIEEWSRKEAH